MWTVRIRLFLLPLFASCCASQQNTKITYLATQASVQDVVRTIAAQAGLGYNWQKSFDQTNPLCSRWVYDIRMEAVTFEAAMQRIVTPVGLRYKVEDGVVVLFRRVNATQLEDAASVNPNSALMINYTTPKKSIHYVVMDLAAKVGLGYNWEKSFEQTDPECRRFVFNIAIKNQSFAKAMATILDPVSLRFAVEDGQVVLYRQ